MIDKSLRNFSKFKIAIISSIFTRGSPQKLTTLLAWVLFPVFYHPLCLCSTYSLVSFLLKHLLLAEKARLNALGHPEEKLWIHSAWLKESHSSSQVKYLLLLTDTGNWSYQNIPALFCFSSFGGLADVEMASLLFSFWRVPTLGQELGCWSLLSLGQFPFHNRDLQAPPQTQHLQSVSWFCLTP